MSKTLIGHSGFVGSNLKRQFGFDNFFNSRSYRDMEGQAYELVVCAGLPAEKWRINQEPDKDLANIHALLRILETVESKHFVLISTIDVYPRLTALTEDFDCNSIDHPHPYGRHRRDFETAIKELFPDVTVVRLPGLFGPGLKKNIIYDLLHRNRLDAIDPNSVFQWYAIDRLWADITTVRSAGVPLCNLFPEPIATRDIVKRFFSEVTVTGHQDQPISYDLRTRHSALFDCPDNGYVQTAEDVMHELAAWLAHQTGQNEKLRQCH